MKLSKLKIGNHESLNGALANCMVSCEGRTDFGVLRERGIRQKRTQRECYRVGDSEQLARRRDDK